jgi:hypothetical protein
MENFRLASRHSTQGFPGRFAEAYNWTVASGLHGHERALEAYTTFFDLLDGHLATRSSSVTSRREAAAAFHCARTLSVDAASCAIRCDNPRHAVALVEQGRGQQWSIASRLKTPVEDLESANPTLARNYLELRKCVSDAAQSSATTTDRAAAATEYRRLTREWEAAVVEIRNIQGFSRFLLPPAYEDVQAAARNGPVIIPTASEYSCSAIIVPTSGEPRHVPLSLVDLNNFKERFTGAIRNASRMNPTEPRNDLIVLLRIVWNEIVLPLVNVLENVLQNSNASLESGCVPLQLSRPFLSMQPTHF